MVDIRIKEKTDKRRVLSNGKIKKIKTPRISKIKKEKVKKIKESHRKNLISFNKYTRKQYIRKAILIGSIIIVAYLVIIFLSNRHILGITLKKEVNQKDSIKIDLATSNNYIYAINNELLVYSNGMLKTYNKYGKKTWEYKFEDMFTPIIKTNGKYIQITNTDSKYIYIFENKYETARIKINGDIKDANINEKGYSSILFSSSGIKAVIGVFNKNGKELYRIKPASSNIANYLLSDDRKYFIYTEVVMQGISITENINLIDTDNINDIKKIKQIRSEMVNNLKIVGNNIDISTDSTIYRYNINSKKETVEKLNDKNIIYLDYNDKILSFFSKNNNTESNSQLIIKKIGSDKNRIIKILDLPKNLKYTNKLSYVLYQKKIEVYNNFGMKIKVYTTDNIISDITVFDSGKSIAVLYSNNIEIINI